jgi:hypothetical protein
LAFTETIIFTSLTPSKKLCKIAIRVSSWKYSQSQHRKSRSKEMKRSSEEQSQLVNPGRTISFFAQRVKCID